MNKSFSYEIKRWNDIKDDYVGASLIIGNGASIAVDEVFKLFFVKTNCREEDWLTHDLTKIFTAFDKRDFE